ncbi:MAG: hypothetical protein ACT4PU_05690 [Planctomycetota bacterium]
MTESPESAPIDILARLRDGDKICAALARAVRREMIISKALGIAVPEWRDGKVVWIQPEDIVIGPEIPPPYPPRSTAD